MKIISIINLKGGVGKTTTAVNMAAILAREYGRRVVLIDADPQANATDFFGARGQTGGLSAVFDGVEPELALCETPIRNVWIVPSDMDLTLLDMDYMTGGGAEKLCRIRDFCRELSDLADFILIDCPPSFTAASCAAIMASEDIIIPVKPDGYVLSGVSELRRQIAGLQRVNPLVRVAGCLITMWHNAEAVRAGEAALRGASGLPVFSTVIRRTDKVDESTYARQTLDSWSPYSSAGRDYKAFVAEYMGG